MAASNVVVIDGSALEGGGQILRNAVALSCLLGQPINVNKIRAGRSNPGLRPQHLTGIQLIAEICGGKLHGGQVSSTEISFYPGKLKGGNYRADSKTAGSICLLLQAPLPCLVFANTPTELCLRGGTNADMAPQIDYTTMVFKPMAAKFGMKFDCDIKARGYFPKGGGEVVTSSFPNKYLSAIEMTDRGDVTRIFGRAFVSDTLPLKVAHKMVQSAERSLRHQYTDIPIEIEAVQEPNPPALHSVIGSGIIIVAETSTGCLLAGSGLGKKGLPADQVGASAARMLSSNLKHGGCVDEYLQDQLILLMALAKGTSKILCGPISLHTETAIHVAKLLCQAEFKVEKVSETTNMIECKGIGFENTCQ